MIRHEGSAVSIPLLLFPVVFVVDRVRQTMKCNARSNQGKPVLLEEGMMTLLRKNVVSNARLLKCADGRGLRVSAQ